MAITLQIANEIRKDYIQGYDVPSLAAKYHLSRSHINNIVNNRRWIQ